MLSEGKREGLRLVLNRSLSEPGQSTSSNSEPLAQLLTPQVLSMPASPCAEGSTLQRSVLQRKVRVLDPAEVAKRVTRGQKPRPFLLLDLRSFFQYNRRHIRCALNLNCSDRFNRKRLQLRRASVVDLASSPASRELLKKRSYRDVVVYDDFTSDLTGLPTDHPVHLVLTALMEDNREPLLLKGGFQAFETSYPELCEDALMRSQRPAEASCLYPEHPASPCHEAAIDEADATEVLPFLFLGNSRNAEDLGLLQSLGVSRVLNVTSRAPCYREGTGVSCKTLPALDSGHQNLRQYFSEAISFIESARTDGARVLVHCQAGVSRSPTIVIAYLMHRDKVPMLHAYDLVKGLRPIISPNLNFVGQLLEWEALLQGGQSQGETECRPRQQTFWQVHEAKAMATACHL